MRRFPGDPALDIRQRLAQFHVYYFGYRLHGIIFLKYFLIPPNSQIAEDRKEKNKTEILHFVQNDEPKPLSF